MKNIKRAIINSIETRLNLAKNSKAIENIELAGRFMVSALQRGNKILIAGNGGSAADAQHFAAELAGKFIHKDRKGLPAVALTTNSSIITAIGNDFGYEYVFSRQLEGLGARGDIFVPISTSGNSNNLVAALGIARQVGLKSIGLLGNDGGQMAAHCDLPIIVPSSSTQAIQETHILIIHIICEIVDNAFASMP